MLGYELTTSTIVIVVAFLSGSFNISIIICAQQYIWYIVFWPLFILFFIGSLAETARVPFDLPEAESELVAGYNVEYASITFAFFFLAEYGNIIMSSNLIVCLFFGGYFIFGIVSVASYFVKLFLFLFLFILIRATLPRFRFDQLMTLGWLRLLPLAMVFSLFIIILVVCFGFVVANTSVLLK
jgi:NADH-quinone oxidoreductase subunit H